MYPQARMNTKDIDFLYKLFVWTPCMATTHQSIVLRGEAAHLRTRTLQTSTPRLGLDKMTVTL
jgi:hypothetical protein